MITKDVIKDTVYELYKQAVIVLGDDVKKSLEAALKIEEHDLARLNIEAILKNIELAEEKGIPMCQDTGLPVVFVKLGNVEVEDLRTGIEEGIKKATTDVPIRPNIVDPITRENTNVNVGDYIPPIPTPITVGGHGFPFALRTDSITNSFIPSIPSAGSAIFIALLFSDPNPFGIIVISR